VVNCGVLTVTFWSSKIFLGFRIYFFVSSILGMGTDRGEQRFDFLCQKAMPTRGRTGMAGLRYGFPLVLRSDGGGIGATLTIEIGCYGWE
jgi:hypothetical protein